MRPVPRITYLALVLWTAALALVVSWEANRTRTLCAFGSCGDPIALPFRWTFVVRAAVFLALVIAAGVAVLLERRRA